MNTFIVRIRRAYISRFNPSLTTQLNFIQRMNFVTRFTNKYWNMNKIGSTDYESTISDCKSQNSENFLPGSAVLSLVGWHKELQGNNRRMETHPHQHLEAHLINYETELKRNFFNIFLSLELRTLKLPGVHFLELQTEVEKKH